MSFDIYNPVFKYNIIYADPPWEYKVWSKKGKGRSAENHYPTMKLKDIMELPVSDIAKKNSVLFMWSTYPNLPDALEVIKAWGFSYKTVAFTWIKIYPNKIGKWVAWMTFEDWIKRLFVGLGYYTRANPEICLLATKGKPLKRISHNVRNIIMAPVREHSRKPDEARKRICELFGDELPKVELFAREIFDGWNGWGNETDKFNVS